MKIDVYLEVESQTLDVGFEQVQTITEYVGGELYEGEYEVTPQFDEQTLPTKEKVMRDDVTVKAIPISRVSNTSGGTTVYIALEV